MQVSPYFVLTSHDIGIDLAICHLPLSFSYPHCHTHLTLELSHDKLPNVQLHDITS